MYEAQSTMIGLILIAIITFIPFSNANGESYSLWMIGYTNLDWPDTINKVYDTIWSDGTTSFMFDKSGAGAKCTFALNNGQDELSKYLPTPGTYGKSQEAELRIADISSGLKQVYFSTFPGGLTKMGVYSYNLLQNGVIHNIGWVTRWKWNGHPNDEILTAYYPQAQLTGGNYFWLWFDENGYNDWEKRYIQEIDEVNDQITVIPSGTITTTGNGIPNSSADETYLEKLQRIMDELGSYAQFVQDILEDLQDLATTKH